MAWRPDDDNNGAAQAAIVVGRRANLLDLRALFIVLIVAIDRILAGMGGRWHEADCAPNNENSDNNNDGVIGFPLCG